MGEGGEPRPSPSETPSRFEKGFLFMSSKKQGFLRWSRTQPILIYLAFGFAGLMSVATFATADSNFSMSRGTQISLRCPTPLQFQSSPYDGREGRVICPATLGDYELAAVNVAADQVDNLRSLLDFTAADLRGAQLQFHADGNHVQVILKITDASAWSGQREIKGSNFHMSITNCSDYSQIVNRMGTPEVGVFAECLGSNLKLTLTNRSIQ